MKLLASDYDCTLNTFECDLRFNIIFIKKFIQKGNIFVLNTGRSYESIKSEINKFHIPYNYLACNDGNLLLDHNNNLISCTNIENKLDDLLEFKEKFSKMEIRPFKFNENVLEYEITNVNINETFLNELQKFCTHHGLCYKTFRVLNRKFLYIGISNISKSSAIREISRMENIQEKDIYTIGDHLNDIEMIRDFNGYTLPWGKKEVKEVSQGVCLSVASLIKKISR